MEKLYYSILVLYLCIMISQGLKTDPPVAHQSDLKNEDHGFPPNKFPVKTTDTSIPILTGNNPKLVNLPPKTFPTSSSELNSAVPPIWRIRDDVNFTSLNSSFESMVNITPVVSPVKNISLEESSNVKKNINGTEKPKSEQDDMLHSKYIGGHDVDELKSVKELLEEKKMLESEKKQSGNEKKASEKDEKKKTPVNDKDKDPKSEFDLSTKFNKNGPKLMNETKAKSGESVLESTSKMMVVSSSVLSNAKENTFEHKQRSFIEPVQTIISVLLSAAFILGLGVIGLLVWKKISMRKFGRDVLINEDDFDEISDMHTFERTQIQIT